MNFYRLSRCKAVPLNGFKYDPLVSNDLIVYPNKMQNLPGFFGHSKWASCYHEDHVSSCHTLECHWLQYGLLNQQPLMRLALDMTMPD